MWVYFVGADGAQVVLANPAVDLKRDTKVRFDGRQARRVSVTTDRPGVRTGIGQALLNVQKPGDTNRFGVLYGLSPVFSEMYVHSTPGVSSPAFHYSESYRLEDLYLEMFTETAPRVEIPVTWWDSQPSHGTRREQVVDGGRGTPDDLSKVDTKGRMVVIRVSKDDDIDQRIADVAASGAASVVVSTSSGSAESRRRGGFPALFVRADYTDRLLAVAKAGGEVTWTSREGAKERYELVFPTDGRIPTDVARSVRTADLASVRTRYHGQTEDMPPYVGAEYITGHSPIGTGWHTPIRPSQERVEHFTPGTWDLMVSNYEMRRQRVTLAAGSETRVSWNRAVLAPGFTGSTRSALFGEHPWAFRRQDMMDVTVPFFTDADGHAMAPDLEATTGSTTLYQDGRLLGTQYLPGRGTFWVGQRGQDYRLVTEVVRDEPWWPLSTKITAEWTFSSTFFEGPTYVPLPLLSARAEPEVDIANRAPAGPVTVPITISRQDGPATISTVAVEFSTDNGTTWHQATVSRNGDRWLAKLNNPAGGFVSLHVKATDSEGNTLDQTVIRAYQVR